MLEIIGLPGIGEVAAGDDLAAALLAALAAADEQLRDDDVLVVSSKVVSKAEGRVVAAADREQQIEAETVRRVAARRTPRGLAQIVQAAAGPVMAAAGVDASNVAPGTVLLLPLDPDSSARALRAGLAELDRSRIGVILSDTAGRAWRDGQIDFALGAAGVAITDDLRGALDTHGQPLEVTVRALADELAAAADLVKGKLTAVPAALVRGSGVPVTAQDGPGAAVLLRRPRDDWFRYGHVEAVRLSLGVTTQDDVDPPSIPAGDVPTRLARALDVAQAGKVELDGSGLTPDANAAFSSRMMLRFPDGARARLVLVTDEPGPWHWLDLGALAQRIAAAAWSEDLAVEITPVPGPPPGLNVRATDLEPD